MGRRTGKQRLTISFDLDGTLTTSTFVDSVWLEGLPRLVARKHGIGFERAREQCIEAYTQVGDDSLLWYEFPYWLEHFGIEGVDPEGFIAEQGSKLELFDDVLPVLTRLKEQGHDLILFSNAARPFLNVEVSEGGLAPFFSAMISVSSDWGTVKSDPGAFEKLKALAGPDLVHVGDHVKFDYEVPMSVGITSFIVARESQAASRHTLSSLFELLELGVDEIAGRGTEQEHQAE
jgi:putative hydrolase of the HAD superfamily